MIMILSFFTSLVPLNGAEIEADIHEENGAQPLLDDPLCHIVIAAGPRYEDLISFSRTCTYYRRILKLINWISLDNNQYITEKNLFSFENITALKMTNNKTINIASLSALNKLRILHIIDNNPAKNSGDKISENIKQLTNITDLKLLTYHTFSDDELSSLTNLTRLFLYEQRQITDSSLVLLTNLTDLNLSKDIFISDESLSCLTNLKKLVLEDSISHSFQEISDKSLRQLTNITDLKLFSGHKLTDNSLSLLSNLRRLCMNDCSIIHDRSLILLTNLTDFSVFYNHHVTPNGLSFLTNLTNLNLYYYDNVAHNYPSFLADITNKDTHYQFVVINELIPSLQNSNVIEMGLEYCANIIPIKIIVNIEKAQAVLLLKSADALKLQNGFCFRGKNYPTILK